MNTMRNVERSGLRAVPAEGGVVDQGRGADQAVDVYPVFAMTIEQYAERRATLQRFISEQLIEGTVGKGKPAVDYGKIPFVAQPCLFKGGAVKLLNFCGLVARPRVTARTEDWDSATPYFAYEVTVTIVNKRTGAIEGEGIGCCNSHEKKYIDAQATERAGEKIYQDVDSNTILSMAEKRALIDGTIAATDTGGMFSSGYKERGERNAERGTEDPAAVAGGTSSTAQRGAITGLAAKVWAGRNWREDLLRLTQGETVDSLNREDASKLIDKLKAMLPGAQVPGAGDRVSGDASADVAPARAPRAEGPRPRPRAACAAAAPAGGGVVMKERAPRVRVQDYAATNEARARATGGLLISTGNSPTELQVGRINYLAARMWGERFQQRLIERGWIVDNMNVPEASTVITRLEALLEQQN